MAQSVDKTPALLVPDRCQALMKISSLKIAGADNQLALAVEVAVPVILLDSGGSLLWKRKGFLKAGSDLPTSISLDIAPPT